MNFSILIAHYNNFKYFQDCYKSIINQTIQNFEVIIVDDCSTDNSLEQIKQLIKNDTRFKIYKNEENKGVGYTKKKCIELATGDICGFLDPDDALVGWALETSLRAINQPDIIATYSQYYECDEDLKVKQICSTSKNENTQNPLFFNIFYQVTHFFCFKKNIYNQCMPLDIELTSAIDQDLYLKLSEKGRFKFINEPLLYYRIHSKGVSQEKSKKIILRTNWNSVLMNTLKRRNINILYKKDIKDIEDIAIFIYKKQNTIWKKILRRLK